jgi:hypothetical protein
MSRVRSSGSGLWIGGTGKMTEKEEDEEEEMNETQVSYLHSSLPERLSLCLPELTFRLNMLLMARVLKSHLS